MCAQSKGSSLFLQGSLLQQHGKLTQGDPNSARLLVTRYINDDAAVFAIKRVKPQPHSYGLRSQFTIHPGYTVSVTRGREASNSLAPAYIVTAFTAYG